MDDTDRRFWRDAVERIVATFLQVVISTALFDLQDGTISLDGVKVAALAGATAVLTLTKALVARWFSSRDSASFVV